MEDIGRRGRERKRRRVGERENENLKSLIGPRGNSLQKKIRISLKIFIIIDKYIVKRID